MSSVSIDLHWEAVLTAIEDEVFDRIGTGQKHNYRAEPYVSMLEGICHTYRELETAAACRRLETAAASIVDQATEVAR